MELFKRGRFGVLFLFILRSFLLGVIRRWIWYGEVGDMDEREFGEDVFLFVGFVLIFIVDMFGLLVELGIVRRLFNKLVIFF